MTGVEGTKSWSETLKACWDKRVLTMVFLGISAGLPLLLIFSTLSVWLREAGVERAAIGFFSWAALGYAFKVVWAPLIDRLPAPLLSRLLGRRRGWLLTAQGCVIAALLLMAGTDPAQNLTAMALFAVMLGFSAATQDIVIDAFRIEMADEEMQGLLSAAYIAGYRVGMILAGAVALEIAGFFETGPGYDPRAWSISYAAMAGVMGIGVLTTLFVKEPVQPEGASPYQRPTADYLRFVLVFVCAAAVFALVFWASSEVTPPIKDTLTAAFGNAGLGGFFVEALRFAIATALAGLTGFGLARGGAAPPDMIREAYVDPFRDFFARYGKPVLIILALIGLYRISDVVMGVMANVFYVDLGFEKETIGRVTKGFGLIMTILGGFLGGALTVRYGVMKALFLGGALVAVTNALFALLSQWGPSVEGLMLVISADNLSGGIASAAFVAYLSGLTNRAHTATQYALFSSLMLLFPKLVAGYSGMAVEAVGYEAFFLGSAALGLPVLILVVLAGRVKEKA